ncbi:hypothetical protein PR048_008099 [Dryococelus australis]|uniref:Uncharacterized protein n=1 Tax=Dryococelus australis TaxID=614101 RepID=A0ABQ9HWG1_9NEOP|nr:hypothetical protein PR048_008099 [Dryococelus australis]
MGSPTLDYTQLPPARVPDRMKKQGEKERPLNQNARGSPEVGLTSCLLSTVATARPWEPHLVSYCLAAPYNALRNGTGKNNSAEFHMQRKFTEKT